MKQRRARSRAGGGALLLLAVRSDRPLPLHRQLFEELRRAILDGRLGRGGRLPSTRSLAADLQLSRSTVVAAYEQLGAEGYIESVGRGATRVSLLLPDTVTRSEPPGTKASGTPVSGVSVRGRETARLSARLPPATQRPAGAFRTSVPALDIFPLDVWGRLSARHWRASSPASLGYGDPQGLPVLRKAIAEYLTRARGVRCGPDQVLVTSGSQQALDLAARVLLDPGDQAWMEDPGYLGAAGALVAAGASVVPVPVDAEGLDVDAGTRRAPRARLAFVTPARQLPLGVTMSPSRRRALLAWAAENQAWILEDDYDSEFRYSSRPLPSLQGIDPHGCVIFTGTFSKVLSPALRLGYVVVPQLLVEGFVACRRLLDHCPPYLSQAVMAEFIAEGHFERHVRRMRAMYRSRRDLLVELLRGQLAGVVEVDAPDAGLNLIAWLPRQLDDVTASQSLAAAGIEAAPLSAWCLERHLRPGLLLGFSGIREADLKRGVQRMVAALSPLVGSLRHRARGQQTAT